MPLPLILDTDIGTDVDDAFALAFVLRHPGIDLRAVTTVSGDTVKRAQIAGTLLRLADRNDIEVAAGLDGGPPPDGRSAWMGHEGEGLLGAHEAPPISTRDALTLLREETGRRVWGDEGLQVATIGMQTNLAAALDHEPALARRIARLAVMGGAFAATPAFVPSDDHNLNVDPRAAVRVLNAGIRTLYVPGEVTVGTRLTRAHLDRLRGGDALCRALVALTERWTPVLRRTVSDLPDDHVALLHDPLTVVSMIDRRFVTTESLPVTVAIHQGLARTFIDPAAGRPAEVVRSVDAAAFADFLLHTVTGG